MFIHFFLIQRSRAQCFCDRTKFVHENLIRKCVYASVFFFSFISSGIFKVPLVVEQWDLWYVRVQHAGSFIAGFFAEKQCELYIGIPIVSPKLSYVTI